MEKRMHETVLLDTYGSLLTDKQCEALRLYLEEDLSLSELGELQGVSRQAVHDSIAHTLARLEEYEEKLSLVRDRRERIEALEQAQSLAENGEIGQVRELIAQLLQKEYR